MFMLIYYLNIQEAIDMHWSIQRLKTFQEIAKVKYYLEIGVQAGKTFRSLNFEHMDGVDPKFLFDVNKTTGNGRHLYEVTSDEFFSQNLGVEKYDLVFIDGLHTYDQTYRDFCNVCLRLHSRSIVIIDDVLPCDKYSAIRNQKDCISARLSDPNFKGKNYRAWHGDVFRLLVFLNLFHSSLCYATVPGDEGVQTVVWSKALELDAFNSSPSASSHPPFKVFDKKQLLLKKMWNLESVDYSWIVKHKRLYNFCSETNLFDYLRLLFTGIS